MNQKFAVVAVLATVLVGLFAGPAFADCPSGTNDPNYCTPGKPIVTTTAATEVTNTGAKLNGTVNPNGATTTYHFEYGTSTTYGATTADQQIAADGTKSADYTAQNVSAAVTGLSANTLYHFRIVGKNANGDATPGADMTFTTGANTAGAKPTVVTGAATNLLSNSATLNGTVNPQGQTTTYGFQYGTTTAYGTNTSATPVTPTDSADHAVSTNVTGLLPGTTYHYRIVAGNASGLSFGDDKTFTTPGAATSKLKPKLTLRARPKRDSKKPYAYRAKGRLKLPAGVSAAQGCNGTVTIKIRRGNRLVGRATTALRANCRYRKKVVVTKTPQQIKGRGKVQGKLHIRAYFGGNDVLLKARSPKRTVSYGPKKKK